MGKEMKTCLVIGASPAENPRYLLRYCQGDPLVICADGGLAQAAACGIAPSLAVGDFDSFRGSLPESLPVLPLDERKDDTDMLAAVHAGLKQGCRRFVLAGGLGGRLDHSYGNFCVLHFLLSQGCEALLAGEREEVFLVGEGQTRRVACETGATVSVFPFACPVCNVSYTGMRYPLDHHDLYSDISRLPMGVSNVVEEQGASIAVHRGTALVIVNLEA